MGSPEWIISQVNKLVTWAITYSQLGATHSLRRIQHPPLYSDPSGAQDWQHGLELFAELRRAQSELDVVAGNAQLAAARGGGGGWMWLSKPFWDPILVGR